MTVIAVQLFSPETLICRRQCSIKPQCSPLGLPELSAEDRPSYKIWQAVPTVSTVGNAMQRCRSLHKLLFQDGKAHSMFNVQYQYQFDMLHH